MLSFVLPVLLAAGGPAAPPITIDTCRFVQSASFARGVQIRYRNTSGSPATMVIFEVTHGTFKAALVDEGTFAPNVTIDHVLTSAPLSLYHGPVPHHCTVTHVHFADGSTWGR